MAEFKISKSAAIAPFSTYLIGTAFAPIVTPHLSERFGRRPVYLWAIFLSAIVTIGSSQAQSSGSLCATRFVAGLLGGPVAVLIEGTYADMWPAQKTLLYYSNQAWASYLGAACGNSLELLTYVHELTILQVPLLMDSSLRTILGAGRNIRL